MPSIFIKIAAFFLVLSLNLAVNSNAVNASCDDLFDDFSPNSDVTWVPGSSGEWSYAGGGIEVTDIPDGAWAIAETDFAPWNFFSVDVDITVLNASSAQDEFAIYPFSSWSTSMTVDGRQVDGVAAVVSPLAGTMEFMIWNSTAGEWNSTDSFPIPQPLESFGLTFTSGAVVFRANGADTTLELVGDFTQADILIDRLWLMGSGDGARYRFDNVCASSAGDDPVAAPENFSASLSGNWLTLSWDPVEGADGYQLLLGLEPGTYLTNLNLGNVSTIGPADLSNVAPGVYYMAVQAYDDTGLSRYSNEVAVNVAADTLGAPSNLHHTLNGSDLTLNWNGVHGASGYMLEFGLAPGTYVGSVDLGTLTSIGPASIASLPAATYFITIRAYDNNGIGPYSNEISFVVADSSGQSTFLGSSVIGSSGGTLSVAGFTLNVPPGAFPSSQSIDVYQAPGTTMNDPDRASPIYEIVGLPDELGAPITIRILPNQSLSGETYVALEADATIKSASPISQRVWSLLDATRSGQDVVTTLEATSGVDVLSRKLGPRKERVSRSTPKRKVKAAVVHRKKSELSSGGHFRIIRDEAVNTQCDLGSDLEAAYSTIKAGVIPSGGLTGIWPVKVYVEALDTDGYWIYNRFWGGYFEFDKANETLNLCEWQRKTVYHEMMHMFQHYRTPNTSTQLWVDEAVATWGEELATPGSSYKPQLYIEQDRQQHALHFLPEGFSESTMQQHGYGSAPLIKYFTDKWGLTFIKGLFESLSNDKSGNVATAYINTILGSFPDEWETYLTSYLLGNIYDEKGELFVKLANLPSTGSAPPTNVDSDSFSFTHSANYANLSAKLYQFILSGPSGSGFTDKTTLRLEVSGAGRMMAFAHKNDSEKLELLAGPDKTITLSNLLALKARASSIIVAVYDKTAVSPYTGTQQITLTAVAESGEPDLWPNYPNPEWCPMSNPDNDDDPSLTYWMKNVPGYQWVTCGYWGSGSIRQESATKPNLETDGYLKEYSADGTLIRWTYLEGGLIVAEWPCGQYFSCN